MDKTVAAREHSKLAKSLRRVAEHTRFSLPDKTLAPMKKRIRKVQSASVVSQHRVAKPAMCNMICGSIYSIPILSLGFGVWGLGFGVWGLGFGVWGLGVGVVHRLNSDPGAECACLK
jgi:hypothetical protein